MQDVDVASPAPDTRAALVDLLRRRPRQAEFVAQIASSLRRANASPQEIERALATLEAERAVIVHAGACADPHLEGTDLRIVALVEQPSHTTAAAPPAHQPETETEQEQEQEQDPVAQAVAHANAVWRRWLSEYLATHTCS